MEFYTSLFTSCYNALTYIKERSKRKKSTTEDKVDILDKDLAQYFEGLIHVTRGEAAIALW